MALPNLGAHPNAVDMATTKQREIRSNSRDWLLDGGAHGAVNVDVASGGTITPTLDERLANAHLRFTGSPSTDPVLDIPETARQLELQNAATRDIITTAADGNLVLEVGVDELLLEDGVDKLLLETSSVLVAVGERKIYFKDGTTFRETGNVGIPDNAFLAEGSVPATGNFAFGDLVISRAKFKDTRLTRTAPSSSSGTLILDKENGDVFEVTLTEDVTTLTLSNFPISGKAGSMIFIAKQDGTGGWDITWPAAVKWEQDTGLSPGQTTDPNAVDIYMLMSTDAGTVVYGFILGLDMQ